LFAYGHEVVYNELEVVEATVSMCFAVSGIFFGRVASKDSVGSIFVFLVTMAIVI
jgi:hypothetical protein